MDEALGLARGLNAARRLVGPIARAGGGAPVAVSVAPKFVRGAKVVAARGSGLWRG